MYKRILTIQDISCVGQCSLTVALPILSACGLETAILPSAVLSTHTAGFSGFTCRDLSSDMPSICAHWRKEGIKFASIYTGYLGSADQVDYVLDIAKYCMSAGGALIVDPAMADNGKLYPAFDMEYVQAMRRLCAEADYILPNLTEACFLTGIEYRDDYTKEYIDRVLVALAGLCKGTVVLTGIGYTAGMTGVIVYRNGEIQHYEHARLNCGFHGTGDVYASAFVGALTQGSSAIEAATIAADYTVRCIEVTMPDESHRYGVEFERVLSYLTDRFSDK